MGKGNSAAKSHGKRRKKQISEDCIVWPPTVIVENTRLAKTDDGRWTGIGNAEMAQILRAEKRLTCICKRTCIKGTRLCSKQAYKNTSYIGHTFGRPKSAWDKEGHRGQVLVRYQPTLEGLREAERLHDHFKKNARGRDEWVRIRPFWHGLPGHEGLEEGPNFVRVDEETKQQKRVLYGYLAVMSDVDKVPKKEKRKLCTTVSKKDIEAKAAAQIGSQLPLSV